MHGYIDIEGERVCVKERMGERVCVCQGTGGEYREQSVATDEEESVESEELGSSLVVKLLKLPSHLRHPFLLFICMPH